MSKRVILRLIEGSFEQGFPVILRIRDNSTLDETEGPGRLPPAPSLLRVFNNWQLAYDQWQSNSRIRPKPGQVNNFSCREIAELGSQLAECFNEWLNSDSSEWRRIRDKLQRSLSETDEIQLIIQTEDMRLRQLPWQLWNFVSNYYPRAEIALSAPEYGPSPPANPTNKVRILAIIGDSTGINVEEDEAILQEELPDAEIIFLTQPQLQVLNHQLWDQHWDILFFAGHSTSQADGSTGQIYINQSDSLSLRDLRNALRTAIRRGLQLAIFNSCDGLGLAQELANLNIPQTIVMRKPVPDEVAQEFLRYFLRNFVSGTPLYLAVREARERLQGLEDRFPCASWLPMICQNPAKEPLTLPKIFINGSDLQKPPRTSVLCQPAAIALGLSLLLFLVKLVWPQSADFTCGPSLKTYRVTKPSSNTTEGVRCVKFGKPNVQNGLPAFSWFGEGKWGEVKYRHLGHAFEHDTNTFTGYAADFSGNGEDTNGRFFNGTLKIELSIDRVGTIPRKITVKEDGWDGCELKKCGVGGTRPANPSCKTLTPLSLLLLSQSDYCTRSS